MKKDIIYLKECIEWYMRVFEGRKGKREIYSYVIILKVKKIIKIEVKWVLVVKCRDIFYIEILYLWDLNCCLNIFSRVLDYVLYKRFWIF